MNPLKEEYKIKIGSLNFKTPFNLFLQNVCHESLDTMIMHKNLNVEGPDNKISKCSVILFKTKIVKSDIIDSSKFIKNKEKLASVLTLEMKQLFEIDFEIKETTYHLKIIYMSANTGGKPISYCPFQIIFDDINEGKIFKYFLEKYKNIYWQEYFEKTIPILPPYMYQYHFFLTKVNSRGDEDSRLIVLTDKYLLNIEYQINIMKKQELTPQDFELKLSKAKWILSIDSFEEMQMGGKNKKNKLSANEFMIKIKINNTKNKDFAKQNNLPYKKKTSVDFIFRNEKMCRFFVYQIKRLFFDINKTNNIKIIENV